MWRSVVAVLALCGSAQAFYPEWAIDQVCVAPVTLRLLVVHALALARDLGWVLAISAGCSMPRSFPRIA